MNLGIKSEDVLSKIDSLDIYKMYMPTPFELNKNCLNPFQAETNPSFRIYYKNGEAFHKSYNSSHKGNAITFVMDLFNIDFPTALEKIAKDFGLKDKTGGKTIEIVNKLPKIEKKEKKELLLSSTRKEFTQQHKDYLAQYGLNINDLKCFSDTKVYALDKFWINGILFPLEKDEMGFIYYIPSIKKQKIYLPLRDKKSKWWSSINFSYIHGMEDLKDCNSAILTKSVKDAAIIKKYCNNCVVAIQAENVSCISEENREILSKIPNLFVAMDSDTTGKKANRELCKLLGAKHINAPDRILEKGGTDFADLSKIEGINSVIKHFKLKKAYNK